MPNTVYIKECSKYIQIFFFFFWARLEMGQSRLKKIKDEIKKAEKDVNAEQANLVIFIFIFAL